MAEFINEFTMRHRNPPKEFLTSSEELFYATMDSLLKAVGPTAFRPERNFNAAVFDSVAVGLAQWISQHHQSPPLEAVRKAYKAFVGRPEYIEAVSRSTADQTFVERRLTLATEAFAQIK